MTRGIIFQNRDAEEISPPPKKSEEVPEGGVWPAVINLLNTYHQIAVTQKQREGVGIHVDEIASKVAFIYERIRKIIDWKEENLIRRAAIERILKRRFIPRLSGIHFTPMPMAKEIAEPLVLELIRGGHLPNDSIAYDKIAKVEKILEKYIYFLENGNGKNKHHPDIKKKINFYKWLWEEAACEIEELLDPPEKEDALIAFMAAAMAQRIKISSGLNLSEKDKTNQIFIAVHHSLFHLDSSLITFRLIKIKYPQWTSEDSKDWQELSSRLWQIREETDKEINHPLSSEFHKICEKYDTVYLILGEILEKLAQEPKKAAADITDEKFLEKEIDTVYHKRLSTLKSRLFRAAIYSTLSILVAGAFSLFVVEVPLASLIYGKFSPLGIVADLLIPTVVMFALVAAVKLPKESNFRKVCEETKKIVYRRDHEDVYDIKPKKKRPLLVKVLISLLYFGINGAVLYFIFWAFYEAKIPVTSLFINTINVAMIVFAGLIIRQKAKEMTVEEKTTFWEFLLDMLSIPVAKLGQWFSKKWREYNLVSVFLTALIDLPFSTVIEFIENWSFFLKEKKAEIQQ